MESYFIYLNDELLTCVRLPINSTRGQIIEHAIEQFNKCPMYPQTCNGYLAKLNSPFVEIKQ